jgi:hypothetical protein
MQKVPVLHGVKQENAEKRGASQRIDDVEALDSGWI